MTRPGRPAARIGRRIHTERGTPNRWRVHAALGLLLFAAGGMGLSASDDGSAVQGVYRGSIHVEHSEKAATGVRAVVLLCDDGRRYVLDPSENSRMPARLDGRRVEILGELRHGFGGGPFLFVRSLTVLP